MTRNIWLLLDQSELGRRYDGCNRRTAGGAHMIRSLSRLETACMLMAATGCSADGGAPKPSPPEAVPQPIINGNPAFDYPEAVLINMDSSACSGALIAPSVVLTAGHCVYGFNS